MHSFRKHIAFFPLMILFLAALTGCTVASDIAELPALLSNNSEPAFAGVSAPDTAPASASSSSPVQTAQPQLNSDQALAAVAAFEGALATIYEQVNPSVVHIQHAAGEGSGFVWDEFGHIVSNNHVVAGATRLLVTFADGRTAEATIVGTDPDSDLAVLKVIETTEQLRPVAVADSTKLRVGELAVAIGNPFGQEGTMTVGFISALGRRLEVDNTAYNIPDVIQTDAAINPGNSGGVLLNPEGEVIGVTSAIISPVRASSGVGFAIPSVIVQRVVPALITQGYYEHPFLGISGVSLPEEVALARGMAVGQRGALLVNIVPGGPADAAGLVGGDSNGDVVLAVDGKAVYSIDDLITYLARYGTAGATVTFGVLRGNAEVNVPVTLGSRPN